MYPSSAISSLLSRYAQACVVHPGVSAYQLHQPKQCPNTELHTFGYRNSTIPFSPPLPRVLTSTAFPSLSSMVILGNLSPFFNGPLLSMVGSASAEASASFSCSAFSSSIASSFFLELALSLALDAGAFLDATFGEDLEVGALSEAGLAFFSVPVLDSGAGLYSTASDHDISRQL